jgi:hypothetical protein
LISFLRTIREQTILHARQKLVAKLPITGELLRGSLLERTVRHTKDYPKCAHGEGHQVFVLTATYPRQCARQFSVRRERVAEVRHWLGNYRELKEAIEAVCELNHELLGPEHTATKEGESSMIEMRLRWAEARVRSGNRCSAAHRQLPAAALCRPRPWDLRISARSRGLATNKRILAPLGKPPPQGYAQWTGSAAANALEDVDVQCVWRFLTEHNIDRAARKSLCGSKDPDRSRAGLG